MSNDISEKQNVAAKYPEVIEKNKSLGDIMRKELGDALIQKTGKGNRVIGNVE